MNIRCLPSGDLKGRGGRGRVGTLNEPTEVDERDLTGRRDESSIGFVDAGAFESSDDENPRLPIRTTVARKYAHRFLDPRNETFCRLFRHFSIFTNVSTLYRVGRETVSVLSMI